MMLVVDDEGHLRLVPCSPAVVTSEADHLTAEQCREREVIEVVNLGKPVQFSDAQARHRTEVAEVDALAGLTGVERLEQGAVLGPHRANLHRAAVGEGDIGNPPLGIGRRLERDIRHDATLRRRP